LSVFWGIGTIAIQVHPVGLLRFDQRFTQMLASHYQTSSGVCAFFIDLCWFHW